ncbi:MAG: hypothetical protein R3C42_00555 [Parvularculaceae bacterium]|nr:hypothetical protein [Parvularculaceae bacterium]
MTKRKDSADKAVVETKELNPVEAIRKGWLAYLGAYGLAFERARPAFAKLKTRYADLIEDLVEKGEEVETTAKEQFVDARDRAKGVYGAGYEKVRAFIPARAANDRVKELEAEVEALTQKLAAVKKPARTKRAKAA